MGSLFYQRLKTPSPMRSIWMGTRFGWPSARMWATPTMSACAGRAGSSGCAGSSPTRVSTWCAAPSPCLTLCAAGTGSIFQITRNLYPGQKETLIQRNQKGLYTRGRNVVGVDLPFDEPQSPDLVLQMTGAHSAGAGRGDRGALYPNIVEHPIDNTDYWNLYYQNKLCPTSPSPFARYVSPWWSRGGRWRSWGAATGGTPSAASLGLDVVAMDLSEAAIGMLRQQPVPTRPVRMRRLRQPHPPPAGEL